MSNGIDTDLPAVIEPHPSDEVDSLGRAKTDAQRIPGETFSDEVKEIIMLVMMETGFEVIPAWKVLHARYGKLWDKIPSQKTLYRYIAKYRKFILEKELYPRSLREAARILNDKKAKDSDKIKVIEIVIEQVDGKPKQRTEIDITAGGVDYSEMMKLAKKDLIERGHLKHGVWTDPESTGGKG